LNPATDGLVLVSYGSHGVVRLEDGRRLECKYRRQVGRPYCGDRVRVLGLDGDDAVVESIHPRTNCFVRGDARQRKHTVAANLDQVLIVVAHRPLPSRDLVARYLLAVHSLGIRPAIVLNKVDLPCAHDSQAGARAIGRLDEYRDLGYPVVRTSCRGEPGIDELLPLLSGKTSILVGQSGVGKSSLVRALLPDMDVQTGALSRVTGKGTHTTTTTMLYDLPNSGFLMDSPGVWEFGLWKFEDREIAAGYAEFSPFAGDCRFNDCLHDTEPGCAIKAAVNSGAISEWRYRSYLRLLEQN
jgi:ribosome biogenesis GTPase